ncbi:MAG TPA: hypothetical protein ENJ95_11230 [Bacteroidetes bacterium]|nr:hypothetical protein [Bacteroidota bacterium]
MQQLLSKIQPTVLFFLFVLLLSCTSKYRYTAIDESQTYNSKPANCQIEYVREMPDPAKFIKIGECTAKGKNHYQVTDAANINKKAFAQLHECACLNGGDVVYIGSVDEEHSSSSYGTYGTIPSYTVDLKGLVYKRK